MKFNTDLLSKAIMIFIIVVMLLTLYGCVSWLMYRDDVQGLRIDFLAHEVLQESYERQAAEIRLSDLRRIYHEKWGDTKAQNIAVPGGE